MSSTKYFLDTSTFVWYIIHMTTKKIIVQDTHDPKLSMTINIPEGNKASVIGLLAEVAELVVEHDDCITMGSMVGHRVKTKVTEKLPSLGGFNVRVDHDGVLT